MNTNHKNRILEDLAKPFDPARVEWKPGAISSDKKKALALAYADLRAYQNRLDEVCSMEWAVTYTPWGSDRVICHLTICGVTRSSTGEADSAAERSEIAGTAAEAQAFKRAGSMFQLGRYLYTLPSVWVEYDAQTKAFTAAAKGRLTGIITQHYQRYMQNVTEEPAAGVPSGPVQSDAAADAATVQTDYVAALAPVRDSANEGTDPAANEPEPEAVVNTLDVKILHDDIQRTGQQLFGNQTILAVPWLVQLWTSKTTPNAIRNAVNALDVDESALFLAGLVEHSAIVLAQWQKHLANEALTTMPPTAPQRTVARKPVSAEKQMSKSKPSQRGSGEPSGPSTRF